MHSRPLLAYLSALLFSSHGVVSRYLGQVWRTCSGVTGLIGFFTLAALLPFFLLLQAVSFGIIVIDLVSIILIVIANHIHDSDNNIDLDSSHDGQLSNNIKSSRYRNSSNYSIHRNSSRSTSARRVRPKSWLLWPFSCPILSEMCRNASVNECMYHLQ